MVNEVGKIDGIFYEMNLKIDEFLFFYFFDECLE
jgi:hypothetical protein